MRLAVEQIGHRHQHAGCAEAALQAVVIPHRLLECGQLAGRRRQSLHGADLGAFGLHGKRHARPLGSTVDEDRAGTAHAVLATDVCAGQSEIVAQGVAEQATWLDEDLFALSIDGERHGAPGHRVLGSSVAGRRAWASARATCTPTRRRR